MALVRYTDWCHPRGSSIIQVAAARRDTAFGDGIPAGFLETIDERTEICRRMYELDERDREVLFLWYVQQLAVGDISKVMRLSRRQCFRRRARAVKRLVEMDEDPQESAGDSPAA